MTNQTVWIAITVGVFVAGIGIGFAALQGSNSIPGPMRTGPMMMSSQEMQNLMEDPDSRQQMMMQIMEDQESRKMMIKAMKENPEQMRD